MIKGMMKKRSSKKDQKFDQVMPKATTQCAVALVVSESAATMLSGMPSSTLLPPQVWHL